MISVVIITKNEELNIERCLRSVQWASETVIVDSGSTDHTLDICKKYNCNIIQTEWLGFGKTKQLAVQSASNEWVLSIDADEEVTPELQSKIIELVQSPTTNGYTIKRNSFYLERMIRYSGWQNDYPLRLFNKKMGQFNDAPVHESVVMNNGSTINAIDTPLIHHPYPTIACHLNKINLYTSLGAEQLHQQQKRVSLPYAFISGGVKFLKTYLIKGGFLDGKEGLVLATLSGFSSTLKYLKLWSLGRSQ